TEQIEAAVARTEMERNRLAALMSELTKSVIVCNLHGRIQHCPEQDGRNREPGQADQTDEGQSYQPVAIGALQGRHSGGRFAVGFASVSFMGQGLPAGAAVSL
ncbi:MAG: hypothetical protein V2J10_06630, partial [Wenzhouxiangella sp.]|nr:hypothetical protein [Wenzhouxiangella sp.]